MDATFRSLSIPQAVSNEEEEVPTPIASLGTPNRHGSPAHQSQQPPHRRLEPFSLLRGAASLKQSRSRPPELYEDGSIPSVPDAPSPYSPPPASLLSSDTSTSSSQPPRQVRTRSHTHNTQASIHRQRKQQQRQQHGNDTFDTMDASLEQNLHRALHQFPTAPSMDLGRTAASPPPLRTVHTAVNDSADPLAMSHDRSSLLPAVLNLKRDLQEAHESLIVLKQENEALASECERYQTQKNAWKEATAIDQQNWKNQQEVTQNELEDLRRERNELEHNNGQLIQQVEALSERQQDTQGLQVELDALRKEKQTFLEQSKFMQDIKTAQLETQVAELDEQLKSTRTKLKEQSTEHARKVRTMQHEQDETVKTIRQAHSSSQLEIDRLKAVVIGIKKQLEESQTACNSWMVASEGHVQEIDRLKALLDEERGNTSTEEQEALVATEKLQSKMKELEITLEKTMCEDAQLRKTLREKDASLEAAKEQLMTGPESNQQEIAELKASLEQAEKQLHTSQAQATSKSKELNSTIGQLKNTTRKLRNEFDNVRAENSGLHDTLRQLRNENDDQRKEIERLESMPLAEIAEMTTPELEEEISRLIREKAKIHDHQNGGTMELQEAVARRNMALKKLCLELKELQGENLALKGDLAAKSPSMADASAQTDERSVYSSTDAPLVSAHSSDTGPCKSRHPVDITERLSRIRDAAERAALVQEHRRELNRLALEHEDELKSLEDQHNAKMKDFIKKSKEEVSVLVESEKKILRQEFRTKLVGLEKKHETELLKIKEEYDHSAAIAEEVMRAAITEAASTSEQLQREAASREKLQTTVRELEAQLFGGKGQLQTESLRVETTELLESLQKECNSIFDRNKQSSSRETSPSSASDLSSLPRLVPSLDSEVGSSPPFFAPMKRSSVAEIDRALEETEALVRTLVGDASQTAE